jgi:antitoxin PrlF
VGAKDGRADAVRSCRSERQLPARPRAAQGRKRRLSVGSADTATCLPRRFGSALISEADAEVWSRSEGLRIPVPVAEVMTIRRADSRRASGAHATVDLSVHYNTILGKEINVAESTITAKGQTTVPADIRALIQAQPGTKLVWSAMPDGTLIVRAKTRSILDMAGMLKNPKGKRVKLEEMNPWR